MLYVPELVTYMVLIAANSQTKVVGMIIKAKFSAATTAAGLPILPPPLPNLAARFPAPAVSVLALLLTVQANIMRMPADGPDQRVKAELLPVQADTLNGTGPVVRKMHVSLLPPLQHQPSLQLLPNALLLIPTVGFYHIRDTVLTHLVSITAV